MSNITRARAKKDPEDKAWIAPLESEARALAKFTLKALSRQQRFTLGRYHALRFGNCTVSEARNRRLGNQIAAGIAGLANSPLYGEITVKQYVNFAAQVHEQRGGAPWYDAWLLKAVVEFEA